MSARQLMAVRESKNLTKKAGVVYAFFKNHQKQEVNRMNENNFMRVDDVARELDVSKSYAYKIVQKLNAELKDKGYLTVSGRVNRKYFMEKFCYGGGERRDA